VVDGFVVVVHDIGVAVRSVEDEELGRVVFDIVGVVEFVVVVAAVLFASLGIVALRVEIV